MEGVVLLHDNARSNVSKVTYVKRVKYKREQLDYPVYSLNMSPCDFHAFGPLKKNISKSSTSSQAINSRLYEGLGLVR